MEAFRVVCLALAIVASGCAVDAAPDPRPSSERTDVGFRPPSHTRNGQTVMPLTFVDGSFAVAVAPAALGIQDMDAAVFTAGGLGDVDRTLSFRHGSAGSLMHEGPHETYPGAHGDPVELWDGSPGDWECANLVYRFGDWFVGVRTCQNDLSRSEKETWARSLEGSVTDDGFLVLEARPPLVLQRTGGHDGPELILGTGPRNWIELEPGHCDPARLPDEGDVRTMPDGTRVSFSRVGGGLSGRDRYAEWCEDGVMRVQVVDASEAFAEAAAESFRLTDVVLAE